jgi:hypothetical protein
MAAHARARPEPKERLHGHLCGFVAMVSPRWLLGGSRAENFPAKRLIYLAPRAGFEPATNRLTAGSDPKFVSAYPASRRHRANAAAAYCRCGQLAPIRDPPALVAACLRVVGTLPAR